MSTSVEHDINDSAAGQVHIQAPVDGMSCASCASAVETTLRSQTAVRTANVNFADRSVTIDFDAKQTSFGRLQEVVSDAGYTLLLPPAQSAESIDEQQERDERRLRELRRKVIVSAACAAAVMFLAMFLPHLAESFASRWSGALAWAQMLLSLPVMIYGGSEFFGRALQLARRFHANMDTLVALGAGTAWLASLPAVFAPDWLLSIGIAPHLYFEAAALIIALILLGRLLEERARHRASASLKSLISLRPDTALVLSGDEFVERSTTEVLPGDVVRVRAGERVPVDGELLEGSALFDESALTGESMPVEKTAGELIPSGVVNLQATLKMRATRLAADSSIERIIRMVRDAQGSKPPVQRLADRVASIFVPIVLVIAIVTFAVWMIFGGTAVLTDAIVAAVSVLVIACPCALGLAVPTAVMVSVGRAAERGILVRDSAALEIAGKVRTVVFDKTGTLTVGKPTVLSEEWFVADGEIPRLKVLTAAAEQRSTHPLAQALSEHLLNANDYADKAPDGSVNEVRGRGLVAEFDDIKLVVGNRALMEDENIAIADSAQTRVEELETTGSGSLVFVGCDGRLAAIFSLGDAVLPEAPGLIKSLQERGVLPVLASGDTPGAVRSLAEAVGIEEFYAQTSPEGKAEIIETIRRRTDAPVLMVGDGINDAPALAAADVAAAIGGGTDVAAETAAITLNSGVAAVDRLFNLSHATMRTMYQNLFWAFIYNIIGIPIAAGVLYPAFGFLLSPMIASAAMAFSSVSVVLNSLRLRSKI